MFRRSILFAAVLFLLATTHSQGQNFSFPVFPVSGMIRDFIPAKWFLKDSAIGDLNGDHADDLAIVIEYKDTINEIRPDSTLNFGSPRVILILMHNNNSGLYDLVLQNNTFIIRFNEGGMDPEAYGKLSVTKGILEINFAFLRGRAEYKIRYQDGDFFLIGAFTSGVSGGQIETWDVNFSTRKVLHSWGGIGDEKLKEEWEPIRVKHPPLFRELKNAYSVEILKDVFI